MLKNRSKTFAPKKVGPRKPAGPPSAASSARPSVEPQRQSRTPAPSQDPAESTTISSRPSEPPNQTVESSTPSVLPEPAQIYEEALASADNEQGNGSAVPKRKRLEEDNSVEQNPPKRITTESGRPGTPPPRIEGTPADAQRGSSHNSTDDLYIRGHTINAPSTKKTQEDNYASTKQTSPNSEVQRRATPGANIHPTIEHLDPLNGLPKVTAPARQLLPSQPTTSANSLPTPTSTQQAEHRSDSHPIPTVEREHSRPVSPDNVPEHPRQRYPTPENLAPIFDNQSVTPGPGNVAPDSLRGGSAAFGMEEVPMGTLNPDGSSTAPAQAPGEAPKKVDKPKRKYTKRKKVSAVGVEGQLQEDGATLDMQVHRPSKRKSRKKKDGERQTRGRKREQTPEGAALEIIDPASMKMADLCKDIKIGQPFSKHKEIKERVLAQKEAEARRRVRNRAPDVVALIEGEQEEGAAEGAADGAAEGAAELQEGEAGPLGTNAASPSPKPISGSGPQMRLVDGQLVLDEESLQIDRHQRADVENDETILTVEENDFTRVITSGTYMKREKTQFWDYAGTENFYKGLRMFGTDFGMIAKMFPHRNRRQIKLKFNSEERNNPDKITRALTGVKEPIDLDHYQKFSNVKLEEVADIKAKEEEFAAQQEAILDQEQAARDAITAQKKADIRNQIKDRLSAANNANMTAVERNAATSDAARRLLATMASDDEDEQPSGSAKENADPKGKGKGKAKAKAPSKRKKNQHSMYGGGEEVIVDGRID